MLCIDILLLTIFFSLRGVVLSTTLYSTYVHHFLATTHMFWLRLLQHSAHMLNMPFYSFPHNLIILNSSTTNFPSSLDLIVKWLYKLGSLIAFQRLSNIGYNIANQRPSYRRCNVSSMSKQHGWFPTRIFWRTYSFSNFCFKQTKRKSDRKDWHDAQLKSWPLWTWTYT